MQTLSESGVTYAVLSLRPYFQPIFPAQHPLLRPRILANFVSKIFREAILFPASS